MTRHHEVVLPEPGEWVNDTGELAPFPVLGIVVPVGGKLVRDDQGGFTVHGPDDEKDRAKEKERVAAVKAARGLKERKHHSTGATWKVVDSDRGGRRGRRGR
jgi:hypothetical protein